MLETNRLILRHWVESDAESLYEYAKNPEVGPIAGWPPHKDINESLSVIKNVFTGAECYAICEKGSNRAIGAVELKLNGHTDMTERDDECELGYWLGKPFWGKGYMPEAVRALLRHGFETLGMTTIWCGYYDGNNKSKRVQEKVGFVYHHTCNEVPVPLMNELRIGHTNYMTRKQWEMLQVQDTSKNIVVKRASAVDANAILEYLNIVGGETDNLTFGAEGLPFTAEAEADYITRIEHSSDEIMLVAKMDEKIVGNASISRLPRRMKHRGDLAVSVLKEYWNKGIGSQLLKRLLDWAENNDFEIIELQVRSDNLGAIHLYEKYGFQKIGMHPAFFKI